MRDLVNVVGYVGEYGVTEVHEKEFPTMPERMANIIGEARDHRGDLVIAVQCAACLVVVTDRMILALDRVNHALGDNVWGPAGTKKYKRCRECRVNGRHPEGEGDE